MDRYTSDAGRLNLNASRGKMLESFRAWVASNPAADLTKAEMEKTAHEMMQIIRDAKST